MAHTENTPALWAQQLPRPSREGHKYGRGHVVLLGGSEHTGAAKLAAFCALRSGAGVVTVACDAATWPVYAAAFQAIMARRFPGVEAFKKFLSDTRITAVLIGPGAGVNARTEACVLAALKLKKAAVLDADALSCFAENPRTFFKDIQSPVILTPHAGEFERLFGKLIPPTQDRIPRVVEAARMSGAILVHKGAETVIASPEGKVVVNHNAPPTLATAGAGDALAGICAGLLGQGMDAFDAACAAVWMHGDAATRFGAGLIADDIAAMLPATLKGLA